MFGSTNLSGLRQAIVVLTLGTAAYKPNDEVRDRRSKSCKETYKRPKGKREDKAQKEEREVKYLACRYASLGHPNKMGALIYTEAIKGQLQWLINRAGWLKKPTVFTAKPRKLERDFKNARTFPRNSLQARRRRTNLLH